MARSFIRISNLSHRWPTQTDFLFSGLNLTFESGWTGLVGKNGTGKTTLMSLISGSLPVADGRIESPGMARVCDQRTDEVPDDFEEFCCFADAHSGRWASRLGIGGDWPWRWDVLSHGERKRAQIATALWRNPEVLLVDEPTNHLDGPSRRLLSETLAEYSGIGIIVSHDRVLLDRLCRKTVFLDPPDAVMRPGGVSEGLAEIEKEDTAARRERENARRELKRLTAERHRRSREAASADKRTSKRGLDPKDHDAKAKIDLVRLSGKDGRAGALKRQLDHRIARAEARRADTDSPSRKPGGITVVGAVSRSDAVVRLEPGTMEFDDGRELSWPGIDIRSTERIALTGPNGAGKSRLFTRLTDAAADRSHVLVIPQELSVAESLEVVKRVRGLSKDEQGDVYSAVDRLGSDPLRLRETELPSPGETRKLLLALGIAGEPIWIAMDEPTNHMDLYSIERLEIALNGFQGGLFLISHDERFLKNVGTTDWTIAPETNNPKRWHVCGGRLGAPVA